MPLAAALPLLCRRDVRAGCRSRRRRSRPRHRLHRCPPTRPGDAHVHAQLRESMWYSVRHDRVPAGDHHVGCRRDRADGMEKVPADAAPVATSIIFVSACRRGGSGTASCRTCVPSGASPGPGRPRRSAPSGRGRWSGRRWPVYCTCTLSTRGVHVDLVVAAAEPARDALKFTAIVAVSVPSRSLSPTPARSGAAYPGARSRSTSSMWMFSSSSMKSKRRSGTLLPRSLRYALGRSCRASSRSWSVERAGVEVAELVEVLVPGQRRGRGPDVVARPRPCLAGLDRAHDRSPRRSAARRRVDAGGLLLGDVAEEERRLVTEARALQRGWG